jgi:uncharacterized protein
VATTVGSDTLAPLFDAAAADDVETVGRLLDEGADPTVLDPRTGGSALHVAATAGAARTAQLLLDAGAPVNQQAASQGATPLFTAAWHLRPAVVEVLLTHPEVNVHLALPAGYDVFTTLDWAGDTEPARRIRAMLEARLRQVEEIQASQRLIALLRRTDLDDTAMADEARGLVADGEDVDQTAPVTGSDHDGHTPLHLAARDGRAGVVDVLVEAGADIHRTDTLMRAHAAHKAASFGHADALRALARHPDFADIVDQRGPYNGYTALHDAVWHNGTEATLALLDAGADPTVRNHARETPAEMAHNLGYEALATTIASHL